MEEKQQVHDAHVENGSSQHSHPHIFIIKIRDKKKLTKILNYSMHLNKNIY